jgi:hypothetical protein
MAAGHAERSEASQRVQGWRPLAGLRVRTRPVEPDMVELAEGYATYSSQFETLSTFPIL